MHSTALSTAFQACHFLHASLKRGSNVHTFLLQLERNVNSEGRDIKQNAMWRQEWNSVLSRRLGNSKAAWKQAHFLRVGHNLKTRKCAEVPGNK